MENIIYELFFVSFLCGWIFLIVAVLMRYAPPQEINGLYGYRTAASMKNKERWDYAQQYAAGSMTRAAIAMIIISLTGFLFDIPKEVKESIGGVLLLLACIYMFIDTEKAIKKRFGNYNQQ